MMLALGSLILPLLTLSLVSATPGPLVVQAQAHQLFRNVILPERLDANGLQAVIKSLQPSIVAYVTPECGHSIPRFITAVSDLNIGRWLPAYYVECDDPTISHLCPVNTCPEAIDVQLANNAKLPDVQVLPWQIDTKLESTAEELLEWISEHVPNYIDKLSTPTGVYHWIEKYQGIHRILVATEDGDVSHTWKIIAFKFLGRARFATIKSETILPQESWKLRMFQANTTMTVTFNTDLDFDSLARIVDGFDPLPRPSIWEKIWDRLGRVYRKLWEL
ncbi:hypothetical protein APHAL10511_000618 [Amanita phalloides]|nr:hypothetical protein APHAL10511_000618 [Amanita phalloides]